MRLVRFLFFRFLLAGSCSFLSVQIVSGATFEDGLKAYNAGKFETALKLWSSSELQNNPQALYSLGVMYANGQGVVQDRQQAVALYREAAKMDHSSAQFNLGLAFHIGRGVEKDAKKAQKWWQRAAKQGHTTAQYNLATQLWSGDGVQQNQAKAIKWFRKAMENGSVEASEFLYALYEPMYDDLIENQAVYRDPKAKRTIPLIEEMGMFKLALQSLNQGSYEQAYNYWLPLAKDGHTESQYMVAKLFESGFLGEKNMTEAVRWYETAAKGGQVYSQYRLGIYHFYESPEINESLGAYWMQVAADQGLQAAVEFMNERN